MIKSKTPVSWNPLLRTTAEHCRLLLVLPLKPDCLLHCDHFLDGERFLLSFFSASLVMNDIITTMFNKKFLEELFKPQELYSKKALRTVFDRLAHASIMRLNQASMDKVLSERHGWWPWRAKCYVLLVWRKHYITAVTGSHQRGAIWV